MLSVGDVVVRSLWADEVLTLVVAETHPYHVTFVVLGDVRDFSNNEFLTPGATLDMTNHTVARGFNSGWMRFLGEGEPVQHDPLNV